VVSLTLIGLALYFVLEYPARVVTVTLFGTPLGVDTPQRWTMVFLLVGLVMAGTDMVIRSHPALGDNRLSYLATFWMLPGLLVLLATQTLGLATSPLEWGASLIGTGLLLWLTIVAEFQQIPTNRPARRWAYLWQQMIGYALALALFFVIYHTRSRSALSATLVLLMSGMIALSLLRQKPIDILRTWLFAAIIGLSLGQMTWALNYWRTSTLSASLLLFLVFYILVGLAQQRLWDKLSRRIVWEFGFIAAIGLVVIYTL
jgi:hypothetical protein